jgi:tRNA 2-thiouridine synthesizing protein D
MERLVIEITHAPYGKENAFTGLLIAKAWATAGHKVIVALHNDGVYAAKKGQDDAIKEVGMPSTGEQIAQIIAAGGRVLADQTCMDVRGLDPGMLIKGVEASDGDAMVDLVYQQGEGVLTF